MKVLAISGSLRRDSLNTRLLRAAAELLPFPELRFGWGLDLHWAALAGRHGWRLGIVDALPVRHESALVGATYGLTNQTLGAVSLLGPLRMDYGKALRTVRAAANELSRFVEEVYDSE